MYFMSLKQFRSLSSSLNICLSLFDGMNFHKIIICISDFAYTISRLTLIWFECEMTFMWKYVFRYSFVENCGHVHWNKCIWNYFVSNLINRTPICGKSFKKCKIDCMWNERETESIIKITFVDREDERKKKKHANVYHFNDDHQLIECTTEKFRLTFIGCKMAWVNFFGTDIIASHS